MAQVASPADPPGQGGQPGRVVQVPSRRPPGWRSASTGDRNVAITRRGGQLLPARQTTGLTGGTDAEVGWGRQDGGAVVLRIASGASTSRPASTIEALGYDRASPP